MSLTLISTTTLGTATANIEFTSIPQTFTDLMISVSARTTGGSAGGYQTYVRFNGSTSNYSWRNLLGTGSTRTSQNSASDVLGLKIFMSNSNGDTAATFGNSFIYIPNYSSSNSKCVTAESISENNGTDATQTIATGLWNDSAAITTIRLFPDSTSFATDTMASLYGITKGTDGVTTVT